MDSSDQASGSPAKSYSDDEDHTHAPYSNSLDVLNSSTRRNTRENFQPFSTLVFGGGRLANPDIMLTHPCWLEGTPIVKAAVDPLDYQLGQS